MRDGNAEALRGLLRGVLFQPAGVVAGTRDDDDLVRRELAEGVLDRLNGVRIADLGLDMTGLGLDSSLGRARDVCGLPAGLVLVGCQPLQGREMGRRGDDAHLRVRPCMLSHAVAKVRFLDRRSRHD